MFIDDLDGMFPDTVSIIRVVSDGYGDYIPSGSFTASCHIEGFSKLMRSTTEGKDVLSKFVVFIQGYNNLNPYLHRFALPSRYMPDGTLPSGALRAISIEKQDDETGACYEIVYL
jgi:hypothetical protein